MTCVPVVGVRQNAAPLGSVATLLRPASSVSNDVSRAVPQAQRSIPQISHAAPACSPIRSVSLLPFAIAMSLHADVLVSGGATIDFHKPAWDSLAGGASVPGFEALTLDETFDQAGAASRTSAQILAG